ncbi:DUF3552 domain-containing protein [Patescibacteria group bacterium]|nr:DUF3552 domain-containing protein [Patescibacteria group bacterium]
MNYFPILIGIGIGAIISLIAVRINKSHKAEIERRRVEILGKGEKEARELLKKAESQRENIKKFAQEENDHLEKQLESLKNTLSFKGNLLTKKEKRNENQTAIINQIKAEIRKAQQETKEAEEQIVEQLKSKTKLDIEEAKKTILKDFDKDLEVEHANLMQKVEEETCEEAPTIAKNLLKGVIQRITSASSVDKQTTSVTIKNDKFKGLLIGKNGKNIEYLESLLPDMDVIFNIEPNLVYIAGLNLANRVAAKKAISSLHKEKRAFDHDKIKKVVEKAKDEVSHDIEKAGREAVKKAKIQGDIPEELIMLIGKLKYRTSFGQNVLQHSIEMAGAASILAAEIGADIEKAKTAAFFHDIGKAIDHDVGGSHDQLSKEILEKHNFDADIVHAAYAHHDAEPQRTPEAMIVKAADAISAGRPGARQESLTNYLERIQKLEETVKDFEGVKKVFAISAGREVRMMVDEEEINDKGIVELATKAAKKIEEELTYPGKIKVNVIRTTKSIDFAK